MLIATYYYLAELLGQLSILHITILIQTPHLFPQVSEAAETANQGPS